MEFSGKRPRRPLGIAMWVTAGLVVAACASAPARAADSLDELIAEAVARHPAVAEVRYSQAAAEQRPAQASLPDLDLKYGYFLEPIETRSGPQRHRLGVSQALPAWGTLRLRRQSAEAAAAAVGEHVAAVELEVAFQVTRSYAELHYLSRAIELTKENVDVLRRFEEIARRRYAVDAASHPDVVCVQLEIGKLEDRLAQLKAHRPALLAGLNGWLARPFDAELASPTRIRDERLDIGLDDIVAGLDASQPALRKLDRSLEQRRIESALARTGRRPGVRVGLVYTAISDAGLGGIPGAGQDALLAEVGVSLPLSGKETRARIAERQALERSLADRLAAERSRFVSAIAEAHFEHADAERRLALYRDTLIPKASESLRSSAIGFSTGKADFLDLLDTERTLLEFQLALERARADRCLSLARLDRLAGKRVPRVSAAGGKKEDDHA